jgi:hypothetical protein
MAIWGTIGGFLTLIAASLAAYYARDAAQASRATVKAFVAVERPRLVLSFGAARQDGETTYITVFAENVGKTSAFVENAHYNVLEEPYPDRPFRNVHEISMPVHNSGKASAIWTIGSDVARHKIPYLGGFIQYRSSFGELHRSYFCARISYTKPDVYGQGGAQVKFAKGKDWPQDT